MADTEIEQINETDLSVKINGNICTDTEQLVQSNEARKANKVIDKNEQNYDSDSKLNSDKSQIESSKSSCSNDGEDDYGEVNGSEDENGINSKDCKSDNSMIEDDNLDSENATMNSDDLCSTENSCNGTKEINRNDSEEQMDVDTVEEQKDDDDDDEQMDDEDANNDEDILNDQTDTESRSNEIKKSLEDSRINLDKSVTIVKVPDPKQSSGSSGKKKVKSLPDITLTPRRSTRNLNKLKTFNDKEEDKKEIVEDDVKILPLKMPMITKPIVVNDTKKLVEIAAGTKQKNNKKEPTLVIIDTNMLSTRNNLPIAVSVQSNTQNNNAINVSQTTNKTIQNSFNRVQQSQTTIKPFILATSTPVAAPQIVPKPPIILPTLTDDMFVVEAPSFIVPYVYEKPPKKPLKEFVEKIEYKVKDTKGDISESKSEEDNISSGKKSENLQKQKCDNKPDTNENVDIDEPENQVSDNEKKSEGGKENNSNNKENGDEQLLLDESDNTKIDDSKHKNLPESTDLKKSDSITDLTVDSDEKKSDVIKDKPKTQSSNYFENPLGKFFMQIGVNLVQEHVQLDLLRTQRRKRDREGDNCSEEVHIAINSLIKTLEFSKENNDPFQFGLKKCELCNFKSESSLVMAHHLETPHMTANYCYRCNFCTFQVRSPHEILQHMDTHNIRGRLERGPALHQCPSCPFEDSYKGKLTRHLISCSKKYRPEVNQAPPLDWEPPAKIPRVLRNKPSMSPGNAVYQAALSGFKQFPNPSMLQLQQQQYNKMVLASGVRARGRTVLPGQRFPGMVPSFPTTLPNQTSGGILLKNTSIKPINQSMIVPTPYSINNHVYQQNSNSKSVQQPSISITPLPRSFPSSNTPSSAFVSTISKAKSQQQTQLSSSSSNSSNKPTFVICEICDGYIKDLEQLRNHMQWIHKVKIHPKMIYNRPPLNCQKCQFRFFTDQGLERHLLGSHGLVTSSMQEAANKGKDGGRCPVCGRVYQWKLLNHVSRDHSMSLKPAHLSYKCTVCTATFGMYKQFENHVYSAHSNVAKNSNKKAVTNQPVASSSSSSLITSTSKQLKINDEITIIPQPPKVQNLSVKSSNSNKPVICAGKQNSTPTTAKAKV